MMTSELQPASHEIVVRVYASDEQSSFRQAWSSSCQLYIVHPWPCGNRSLRHTWGSGLGF